MELVDCICSANLPRNYNPFCFSPFIITVIASRRRSNPNSPMDGLPRRFAPRNDEFGMAWELAHLLFPGTVVVKNSHILNYNCHPVFITGSSLNSICSTKGWIPSFDGMTINLYKKGYRENLGSRGVKKTDQENGHDAFSVSLLYSAVSPALKERSEKRHHFTVDTNRLRYGVFKPRSGKSTQL